MTFAEKVQQELTAAMKAREELRLRVLRMLKTALHNRKIEKGAELDDAEAIAVVKSLIKQRHEAAAEFRKGGAADRAAEEEKEVGILEGYLPAAVGEDQVLVPRIGEEALLLLGPAPANLAQVGLAQLGDSFPGDG